MKTISIPSISSAQYAIGRLIDTWKIIQEAPLNRPIDENKIVTMTRDSNGLRFMTRTGEIKSLVRPVVDQAEGMILEVIYFIEELDLRYEVARFRISIEGELLDSENRQIASTENVVKLVATMYSMITIGCLDSQLFKPFPRIESPQKP